MSAPAGDLQARIEAGAAEVAGHFLSSIREVEIRRSAALTRPCSRSIMMPMRTTLTLNDDIMKSCRRYAADQGRPLKDVIDEALRLGLDALRGSRRTTTGFELKVTTGRGLQPGVRLDDRDALFALMDGR